MITCKEELQNTYVNNTTELRKAFIAKLKELGVDTKISPSGSPESVVAYWDDIRCGRFISGCWHSYADEVRNQCKQLTLEDLKPQTKEAGWVNGDACIYDGSEYTFVGMTPTFNDLSCIVFDVKNGIEHVCVRKLSKPETEAERKEREELEAAYDLLCIGNRALNVTAPCTFDEFKIDEPQCDFWLSIVRKTNYKVKGE